MKPILTAICLFVLVKSNAQLTIQSGGTFFIETGGKVTVQGDVLSNADIQGAGTLVMKGSALQSINMNGKNIPNLEIDNTSNVTLDTTSARIVTSLVFTNGKIKTGNKDLVLASTATVTGQGTTKFVWTNGTGQLKKELTANVTNFLLPVGENANYRPATLTTASVTSYSNASVGVRSVAGASANKPPMIASAINAYWAVTKTGITGGTTTLAGQYTDADIAGTESALNGYYYNGTDWSSASEAHNNATNTISAPITAAAGQLSAMNKFLAVGARAFLQGAGYNTNTGLMNDALRSGTNIIPLSDPYRSSPYAGTFIHISNTVAEAANASVFATQAPVDNSIVDWVFLELRNTNASPGNTILQTRSALLQRDGDIVDVDGTSPVTFNGPVDGTYALSVRHRNHLGLSLNPATSGKALSEKKSIAFTTNVIDLRTATQAQLFGTAANHTTAAHPTLNIVNLLWGGNANPNGVVRYSGGANDKDYILLTTLGGMPTNVLSNVYSAADLNMNRVVRYSGGANDKDFLFINSLGSVPTQIRLQALPN